MSPAIQGDYISSLDPVQSITQLAGGLFEVELLAGPVAGAYVSRRLTTEQLLTYLTTQGLGGPLSPLQSVRFRTRAEASAPGAFGGAVLEELDYSTLFTYARVLVEFWRDDPTNLNEHPRTQELIAVFDPKADAAYMGYATSGGPAAGVSRLGLRLVFPNDPAATGVLKFDATQLVLSGQVRYFDDGGGTEFYEARQNMLAPVPDPVRGTVTAYWKPVAKPPVPGTPIVASLYYDQATAKATQAANKLPAGRPTVSIRGTWNGQANTAVWVQVLEEDYFSPVGIWVDDQGVKSFVKVDLDAGAVEPYESARPELPAGTYTVQPTDVTSPASVIVIPVANAGAFGNVLIEGVGGTGTQLVPGSGYTAGPGQLELSASITPPLQVGDVVHFSYALVSPVTPAAPGPAFDIFTQSDTWVKPAGVKKVRVVMVGGGGGGGSGSLGVPGTMAGAASGGGGARTERLFIADVLPATAPVTVGHGGLGGESVSGSTPGSGQPGTAGGDSIFGDLQWARGGSGAGGGINQGSAPAAVGARGDLRGGAGAPGATQQASAAPGEPYLEQELTSGAGGGGAGAGADGVNVAGNGGDGGINGATLALGRLPAPGGKGNTAGHHGADAEALDAKLGLAGNGGGGGAYLASSKEGGRGGKGGFPGGGGGAGSGGYTDGTGSGPGGNGAGGVVLFYYYY